MDDERFVRGGNVRRDSNYMPVAYFVAGCCTCVVIFFILIWIAYAMRAAAANKKYGNYNNQQETYGGGKILNFHENELACSADNRFLPHPRSQEEENEVVLSINSTVNPKCEFVFFGYTADEKVRYQSISADMTWPSLKTLNGGVLPLNFKDCYEVMFLENGSLTAESVVNCGRKIAKYLLFLTRSGGEDCSGDSFKCIEIYNSLPNDDVETSFKTAKEGNPNLLMLFPFDKNHPPESLQLPKSKFTGPVIVMAVKYKFIYKYGNETQPYTSSRFTVVNPEYDCVAYDIKKDKIVTRNCKDKGCPVCT